MEDEIEISGPRPLQTRILELVKSEMVFSDILIHEDQGIMVKLPTGWTEVDPDLVDSEDLQSFLKIIDPNFFSKLGLGDASIPTDRVNKAIDLNSMRIRCNAYLHGDRSLGLAIRRLPISPPTIQEAGLPHMVTDFLNRGRGLLLATGPTGSGKTTTLAALMQFINKTKAAHIITVEDPIEYIMAREKAVFSQREVGKHIPDFQTGLDEALRQRPDIIVIGEIRTKENLDTCLYAAESGHLVLATLHTNNAVATIGRILSHYSGSEIEQKARSLSEVLIAIISQVLVPSKDGKTYVLATEVLENNDPMAKAIAEQNYGQMRQLLENIGMRGKMSYTLNEKLVELVKNEKISPAQARMAAYDKVTLKVS